MSPFNRHKRHKSDQIITTNVDVFGVKLDCFFSKISNLIMAFKPHTINTTITNTWVTKFGQSTHDDYKSAAANLSKANDDLKDTDDRIII